MLLERIIATCVETADAGPIHPGRPSTATSPRPNRTTGKRRPSSVLRAMFRGDGAAVRAAWPELLEALRAAAASLRPHFPGRKPACGSSPRDPIQRVLARLLAYAPAAGVARARPTNCSRPIQAHGAGPSGRPGRRHRVRPALRDRLPGDRRSAWSPRSEDWPGRADPKSKAPAAAADLELVDCLEQATDAAAASAGSATAATSASPCWKRSPTTAAGGS